MTRGRERIKMGAEYGAGVYNRCPCLMAGFAMLCLFYHLFHFLFRRDGDLPACAAGKDKASSREDDDEVIFWP